MLTLAHGHTAAHRAEPGISLFMSLWHLGAKSKDTSLQCQTQPGATQEHSAHRLSTDMQSSLSAEVPHLQNSGLTWGILILQRAYWATKALILFSFV